METKTNVKRTMRKAGVTFVIEFDSDHIIDTVSKKMKNGELKSVVSTNSDATFFINHQSQIYKRQQVGNWEYV